VRIVILTLTLVALALGACGRRGPLEPAPGEKPPPKDKGVILDPLIR
jgi:predicted small lipoprotein YifL